MKIKTLELSDAALDWAVAVAEGGQPVIRPHRDGKGATIYFSEGLYQGGVPFRPTKEWAKGGPIIEREKIETYWHHMMQCWIAATSQNLKYDEKGEFVEGSDFRMEGPTPLIVAMRCYVASTMGDEVEIPEELL